MSDLPGLLRLMLVADERLLRGRDVVEVCRAAEQGGVTAVLLRCRAASARELAASARALLAALSVPVLVHERADVAIAVGAAGVHLGPLDTPVPLVRRIASRGFLIGASVGSLAETEHGRGADYWMIGPWRTDSAGPAADTAVTRPEFVNLVRRAEGRPCVAVGGLRPVDVRDVRQAGATGVAVASAILDASDVRAAAHAWLT